jgi:hypothetical protein
MKENHASILVRQRGKKWLEGSFMLAFVTSVLIALFFSESSAESTPVFKALVQSIGRLVPAIDRLSSVSRYPALTATIYALNWVFVPIYFVLFMSAGPFWDKRAVAGGISAVRNHGRTGSLGAPAVGMALCFGYIVLADLGVFHTFSFYSAGGYQTLPNQWMFRAWDSAPMAMAVVYWLFCMCQAAMYYLLFFAVGAFCMHDAAR